MLLQDIHTNAYIAQALNSGGVRAEYLPPLITIIGYLMSFAAGSVSQLVMDIKCRAFLGTSTIPPPPFTLGSLAISV